MLGNAAIAQVAIAQFNFVQAAAPTSEGLGALLSSDRSRIVGGGGLILS